jgi:hypothetical protein
MIEVAVPARDAGGRVIVAKASDFLRAVDAARAAEEVAGADGEGAMRIGARVAHRPRLVPGVKAPELLGAENGGRYRSGGARDLGTRS